MVVAEAHRHCVGRSAIAEAEMIMRALIASLALALTLLTSAAIPASADPWVKAFLSGADLTTLVQVQHVKRLMR
jgi:hypothetical protein